MKKIVKMFFCVLLAAISVFYAMPEESKAEETGAIAQALYQIFYTENETLQSSGKGTSTVPEIVSAEKAKEKLNDLIEKFEGIFFTVSGNYCPVSGMHNTSYSNCLMSNVISTDWVTELVGRGELNASLCPTQYNYNGSQWSFDGWQCFGFANFAHWYIFAEKNTDKIMSTLELTGPMTQETMVKALPGDVIRSNYYGGHSMVFIGCDSEGYEVIDCNYTNNSTGKTACIIKVHKINYNSRYTVAITGVQNYDRESATEFFVIKYNANGGKNAPGNQIKTEDIALTITKDVPTREGCEFLGWAKSEDAKVPEYLPGAEFSENADTTLFALWSECSHSYKAVVTPPTNTEQGYTTYTCEYCGTSYKDDYTGTIGCIKCDMNRDGTVDVTDVYYARLVAAKLIVPSEEQKNSGDVDGDVRITAIDANYIRKYTLKIIDVFPADSK